MAKKVEISMAAAPDPAVPLMEKLLECCFCTETLTKPRTLSCFHSFCHNCLERDVATRREDAVKAGTKIPEIFECPICRTEFHVKENESVEKIPSNFFMNNLLELLTLQQQAQCIKCQSCKRNDAATSRCVSCDKYLCGKCLEAHNNWSDFGDHIVMTIEELAKPENRAKARGKPRCDKHKKVLKFYCETCKVLVCRYCMDLNHQRPEHSWFPLSDIVEQKKEAIKASSAIFEEQMNEAFKSNLKIEHVMETLKNNVAKARDAIMLQQQEILNEFTKVLEQQTAVLLDQIDMKYNEVSKPLMKQQADVKDYLENAKSSLDFAKNIILNGTDEEILSLKHEVEEKAKEIEKERPETMEPVHNGAIEYQGKSSKHLLKNVIPNDLGEIGKCMQIHLMNLFSDRNSPTKPTHLKSKSSAFNRPIEGVSVYIFCLKA